MISLRFYDERYRCVIRCSNGTRKKISVAIALIGNPDFIILDEPTTGLDFYSKRLVWDIILANWTSKKTFVLTSPSIEEAEAVSTRIGVLDHGTIWQVYSFTI